MRRCSPPVPGRSATTRTAAGASPVPASSCRATGRRRRSGRSVRLERLSEDRVEVVAPARAAAGSTRRCGPRIPTRSRRSTSSRWQPLPAGVGIGRIGTLPCAGAAERLRRPRRHGAARDDVGGARLRGSRPAGVPGGGVRRRGRFAARSPRPQPTCRPTSPRICGTIPPTSTPADRRWRWSTWRTGPVNTRGARRPPMYCRSHFGDDLAGACQRRCAPTHGISPRRRTAMKAEVCAATFAAGVVGAGRRAGPDRAPRQATCPSSRSAMRIQADHRRRGRSAGRAGDRRWRTWTPRCRGWSPRSTRCASARTATGAAGFGRDAIPSRSPTCSTSWRPCSGGSPAWRTRCWK